MRINKFLALAGMGSRRKVEEFVKNGRVCVNDVLTTSLATDISDKDVVTLDGNAVKTAETYEYYMLNKPKGYITSTRDQFDRKTVMDLLANVSSRVFPVGRLDYDTEGLLLITNDGDMAERLTKPEYHIAKTYNCTIEGQIKESELAVLRAGIVVDRIRYNKCKIKVVEKTATRTKLKVIINEGKNRQIRNMFEFIGKRVVLLNRVAIGDIHLGGLSRGEYRKLKQDEIKYLMTLCSLDD